MTKLQPLHITTGLMIILAFFYATPLISQSTRFDPGHRYPEAELQSDFLFLRAKLEKINPDLYLYTDKKTLNLFLDSLYQSISVPQTEREFYDVITLLNSKIKDGHTMLLPSDESRSFYNEHAGYFPFYVIVSDGRLFINMNCSRDTLLKEGAEITSINGISGSEILHHLLQRQIRDGNNQTYPVWILTRYFKDYYGFSYGHPASFSITYTDSSGMAQSCTVAALSRDSIRIYRELRYRQKTPVCKEKQGIVLETGTQAGVATLTIRSFDNDILRTEYKQAFRSTIGDCFARIRSDNIHDLIIDLRDNQGGDWEPGRILLSHLLLQPIAYLENSVQASDIIPFKNNYTGNLYVLINGGSFSNSGIVSSYLESTGRAIFIGEEAAGNRNVINGEPKTLVLPATRIHAEISTRKFVIRSGLNDGHGVMPGYLIIPTVENIIGGKDVANEFIYKLIAENK